MTRQSTKRGPSQVGELPQYPLQSRGGSLHYSGKQHSMTNQNPSPRRGRRLVLASFVLLTLVMLLAMAASAQSWPRCITGCTAGDVELVGVTADVLGSCTPGGSVETDLVVELFFNRVNTYCVRFVADIYIDGKLANFEIVLNKTLSVVERGRDKIRGDALDDFSGRDEPLPE